MDTSLSEVLLKLAKKIIHGEIKSKQDALVKLLLRIDSDFFKNLTSLTQGDYESITKMIVNYYSEEQKERIKKIFLIKAGYTEKFIHIFQLILDLAFNTNEQEKEKYLEEIINMNDHEKEVLMPYVEQVMKRKFIEKLAEVHEQLIDIKEQEFQELRDQYDELKQNYLQLLENYNSLKAASDKAHTDCQNFQQEKYQCLQELGMTSSIGLVQVAQRVKKELKEFEFEFERLNKELEERNKIIVSKTQEIKELSSSAHHVDDYHKQLNEQRKINTELNECLAKSDEEKNELKEKMENFEFQIEKLNKDIEEKEETIRRLQYKKQRYNQVKKVHMDFKKNLLKKYINR